MAFLKSISGHTTLAATQEYLVYGDRDTQTYLEKNSRAIAMDMFHIRDENDWARQMDETRSFAKNDTRFGKRKAVTYRHFIISPNPKDSVSLEQLRVLVTAWVEEQFTDNGKIGTFEVAVIYHDDNKERIEKGLAGIPHAHIIVNNTDLITQKRMQIKSPHALAQDLQRLAKEHGLSHFQIDDEVKDEYSREAIRNELKDLQKANRNKTKELRDYRPSQQPVYLTKFERILKKKGEVSWKQLIRENIDIACNCCKSYDEVIAYLAQVGIQAVPNKKGDDYIFYPYGVDPFASPAEQKEQYAKYNYVTENQEKSDGFAARVSGKRLGRHYSIEGIERQINDAYYRRLAPEDKDIGGIKQLTLERNSIVLKEGSLASLAEISKAFAAISGNNIHTIKDAKRIKKRYERSLDVLEKQFKEDTHDDDAVKAKRLETENSISAIKEEIEKLDSLIKISKRCDILPKDESRAKTMPINAASRRERIESEKKQIYRQKKAPLREKIKHGWDLTEKEKEQLDNEQKIIWQRNRNREAARSMREKITHGWDLTEAEYKSLTPKQQREWKKNHLREQTRVRPLSETEQRKAQAQEEEQVRHDGGQEQQQQHR